jgi:exopolyphosphatase/guanosine-5'-triphosphate,3'-diphosphate pyrophosphatase
MRLGVLDVGSNSAQLQVVDARSGAPPLPTYALKAPTLLGQEFDAAGAITATGVDRIVDAVGRALRTAREFAVDQLYVFVTAAVRDAANRDLILDRLETECGVRPQFLAGEDEARLTYLAAHRWYGWSAGRLLMIDIGGGSMEIALGRDAEPDLVLSLPLGAGRLTREFLPDDVPSSRQLKELRIHVNATLREVSDRLRWEGPPDRAVATSKTFKQLARLAGAPPQRKGPFVRRTLTAKDLAQWIPRLAQLSVAERAQLRGVSVSRARQIIAGAVVAKATMKALDVARVEVSPWALREGIVLQYLQCNVDRTPVLPLLRPATTNERTTAVRSLEAKRNEQNGALS